MAGYGGLMSVGIQAFVGIGGYSGFIFAQHLGLHPFLSIPLGGRRRRSRRRLRRRSSSACAAAISRLAPGCSRKCSGSLLERLAAWRRLRPEPHRDDAHRPKHARDRRLSIAATVLIVASIAINLLLRSRFGLGLTALRDSEDAAESQGVDVKALKLQVYTLASFGAGLVGAIYFTSILRISPNAAFDPNWAVAAVFIVVIGGIGTLEGPIVGTAIFFALRWGLPTTGPGTGS